MDDEARKQLIDKLLAGRIQIHENDSSTHIQDSREKFCAHIDKKRKLRKQYLKNERRKKLKYRAIGLLLGILLLALTIIFLDNITIFGKKEDPFLQIYWGVVAPMAFIIGIVIYINIRDRNRKRKIE